MAYFNTKTDTESKHKAKSLSIPKATSELDQAIAEADRGQVEMFNNFNEWSASLK